MGYNNPRQLCGKWYCPNERDASSQGGGSQGGGAQEGPSPKRAKFEAADASSSAHEAEPAQEAAPAQEPAQEPAPALLQEPAQERAPEQEPAQGPAQDASADSSALIKDTFDNDGAQKVAQILALLPLQ